MLDTYQKILGLLTAKERRTFCILLLMALVMGVTEAVGVASIMPFIALLSDPHVIETNPQLQALYRFSGSSTKDSFLVLVGAGVFVIVVTSLLFKTITLYALVRFGYMRNFSLSTRLLTISLRQPYAWFLSQHSADLGKTVLSEVDHVVSTAVVPAMKLLAQTVVVIFLVGLIIAINPVVALASAALIAGSYIAIYTLSRKYLSRIGQDRVRANSERYKLAQEAFGGIKDVKVLGLEDRYRHRFRAPAFRYSRRQAAYRVLSDLPRHLLEAVAFGGMLALILLLLLRGDSTLGSILPLVGLYAFAGARLLPAMQTVFGSLTSLRFSKPALNALHQALSEAEAQSAHPQTKNTAQIHLRKELQLRSVTYTYPGASAPALQGLSLTIPANTTVAFVGGSGAGKTTAADIILGLLLPDGGELIVDGLALDLDKLQAWQRSIGYVPQHIFLADDSIAANIAFGIEPSMIDHEAVTRAARMAKLESFILDQLPEGYATKVGERGVRLSGGQRQRIGIARALYHDPDVLVLDEATSALDNLTEQAVMDAVDHLGHKKTIILIAHRLSTVRNCDRIYLLKGGQLAATGTYDELLLQSAEFQELAASPAQPSRIRI